MMPTAVIVVTALCAGASAFGLSRWARALAGTESRWLRTWVLVTLTGLGGVGAAVTADNVAELLGYSLLAVFLAVLVVVDLAVFRLPDAIVAPLYLALFGCLTVAAAMEGDWGRLGRAAAAAGIITLGYLVLALIAPANLGLGDVKLAGLIGAFLGWLGWSHALVGTLAAFVLAGVFALLLVVAKRAHRHTAFAFGPWMVAGAAVGVAFGSAVV
jgi:leader peptidase (prepilin peptidase)/N-methyltransferase